MVLLPALLLAFSIWLIHNLSLKYNDYINVSVIAKCDIDGHSDMSANRCEVMARCRATGYKVLRSGLRDRKPVTVTFRPSDMHHLEGDVFYIKDSELLEYANVIYGADVTVDYFLTDTMFFRFPFENFRKLPVVPITSLKYRDQYMADGDMRIEPDSVIVYGEPFHLESLEAVHTRPLRFYDISEDLRGVVDLERIKGVRLSDEEIHYSLDVKRFVEITSMLSVRTVNVPSDKVMSVFPSVVEVSLRCNFPLVDDPLQGLGVEADYIDLQKSLGGKCVLRPTGLTRGVISCNIHPVAVSCVVEDR